ncbi:MAG: hypothetical protein ABI882_08575 [Acidobacteriota bacterium]
MDGNVRWGEWIGEGWQMFANQWQSWILIMLVFILLILIPVAPLYGIMIASQLSSISDPELQTEPPAFLFALLPVIYGVIIFCSSFLMAGAYRAAFKQLRGAKISVKDLFSGGDVFLRVVGGAILVGLLVTIGAVFCILPGLAMMGLFYFTMPLIVEGRLGVVDAMKASFERTKAHWFMFVLFALVVSLLAQIGSVACGIGVLATFPLFFTINAVAYRDLFGVPGALSFLPQHVHSPENYSQPSPPGGQSAPTRSCPRCGATGIAATAKFCNLCGANLVG